MANFTCVNGIWESDTFVNVNWENDTFVISVCENGTCVSDKWTNDNWTNGKWANDIWGKDIRNIITCKPNVTRVYSFRHKAATFFIHLNFF
jgi:hypothetical protein